MKSVVLAAVLALVSAPALADTFSFGCFSEGDIGYEVIVDDHALDQAQFNISGGYDFPDDERNQTLFAAHVEEGLVFRNEEYLFQSAELSDGTLFFTDFPEESILCELMLHNASAAPQAGGGDLWRAGMSLGGNLRSGPGMTYARAGSLAENTPLTIVRGSGVVWEGYEWFEVEVGNSTAYQWGGIMCARGPAIPGVYATC